jgi:hypothetical protein
MYTLLQPNQLPEYLHVSAWVFAIHASIHPSIHPFIYLSKRPSLYLNLFSFLSGYTKLSLFLAVQSYSTD